MRSVFLIVAISALAWARPETYKETEDFKYSRSSSDEGSKSGFYGAQRGNMGGNYERAHNMDTLAQNQMSGAVRQVEGELGDASKMRTGSAFTAANSRGIYGSGNYDLTNLQGRNFAESSSFQDTHSALSSAFNQHSQNSDWRRQSQHLAGLSASNQFGQVNAADDTNSIYTNGQSRYGKTYDRSSGFQSQSGYHSESGYQGGSAYNQLSSSAHNGAVGAASAVDDQTQSHYIIASPVRIIARPGTQVTIPVYAQAHDSRTSSAYSQNSEAEVLNNNQHVSVPQGNPKHYESSYNYRKAWERHSETTDVPSVAVPTVNPFPKNSELNEDAQASSGWEGQQLSTGYNRHNSHVQSGSSQFRHHDEYSSQHNSHVGSSSNAYTQGAHGSLTGSSGSLMGANVDSQPKSYQSAYSYHKSWERQGDPYVIYPATNGGTKNSASSSHQQYRQSHQHYSQGSTLDCDCDEYGHPRAKRSYHGGYGSENVAEQTQQSWQNFAQENKPEKLEDLGQQTQQTWQGSYQQAQNKLESLEDLGQQTQQSWGNFEQQNQPEKLEDLGQQTQEAWQESDQQTLNKLDSLQDLGQQTQQSWGNFEQQTRPEKLEDLGQQTQETWEGSSHQTRNNKLEDLGQQAQQSWGQGNIEQQVSQQSQQTFGDLENQQTQSKLDDFSNLGQQTQQTFDSKDFTEQHQQNQNIGDLGQQTQHNWNHMDNLGQQSLTQWGAADKNQDTLSTEQQTLMHAHSVDQLKDDKQIDGHTTNTHHITQNSDYFHNSNHPGFWDAPNGQTHEYNEFLNQNSYSNIHSHYNSQRHGVNWQETSHKNEEPATGNNPLQSLWDKIDNLEEQSEHSSYDRHEYNEFVNANYGHGYTTSELFNNSNNRSEHQTRYNEHTPQLINETEKTNTEANRKQDKYNKDDTINVAIPEIEEVSDVGRGDIGAEDSLSDKPSHKNVAVSETASSDIKPEKTPEDIEALSLSIGTETNKNSDSDSLRVLSISQQKWLHDQRQAAYEDLHKTSGSSVTVNRTHSLGTVATVNENNRFRENNLEKRLDNSSFHKVNQNQESEQNQDLNEQNEKDLGQETVTINDHSFGQQLEHFGQSQDSLTLHQQSNVQLLENFGQHSQDKHHYLHHSESQDQLHQKFDQHNTWQQSEDFGQQTQDQHSLLNFESQNQQNLEQQLQDFGQQSQDLNQQALQQFETSQKFEQDKDQQHKMQEFESFGQQSHGVNQQDLEQFGTSGKLGQNPNQQMMGQELEDFGQQRQDMIQQNSYQHGAWKEINDFNQFNRYNNNDDKTSRNSEFPTNNKEINEEKFAKIDIPDSQSNPKKEVEIPAIAPTEKPGFWKSIGSKFTNAKDSVASWFKRS